MEKVKKIDIHAHLTPFKQWCPSGFNSLAPMISDEELIAMYDKLNVEKGLILPLISPEVHSYQLTNAEAKLVTEKYPDRFMWFCNIDPRMHGNKSDAKLSDLLLFYKNLGAKGLGELTTQLPIDHPFMENLFYHCAECDMPITIHLATMKDPFGYYGIQDDLHLPRLEKMLKKYPKLKIFGHSQTFWAEISGDCDDEIRLGWPLTKVTPGGTITRLLRECPNLYCDFSAGSGMGALQRDEEHAAKFIEEFSDRIMFGWDVCASTNVHPFEYEDFLDGMLDKKYISEENYYKFVRGNAIRILNLDLDK